MSFTMSKDTEKPPGNPSETDRDLWQRVTQDIRQLSAADKAVGLRKPSRFTIRNPVPDIAVPKGFELPSGGGIDRKTEDRLRKGEIAIEARLDLHGHTLSAAREKLLRFIAQSFASNKRTLLVITGKGRQPGEAFYSEGKGAIKREFMLWLEDPAIRHCILSSSLAQPRHGGSGAYYIYLRKKK